MARWPPLPNEKGDTRWGFRSRLIILKSLPSLFDIFCSHFSLLVFVNELSFDLCHFIINDIFCFPNGFVDKHVAVPNFNLINQPSLDKILKVEVFVHSDG